MIYDNEAIFSDQQDLSQVAGTYISTNVVKAPANTAWGEPLNIPIQVTEDFVSAGAATLKVQLYTDSVVGFGSEVLLAESAVIAKSVLVAGYVFSVQFLPEGDLGFLRIKYVIGTATTTAGLVTAGFVETRQTSKNSFPVQSNP